MSFTDLADKVAGLLRHPADNPRRTAIAMGFIFVLFLAAVVVALLFLPKSDEEEELEETFGESEDGQFASAGAKRRRPLDLVMSVATAAILLVVIAAVLAGDHYSRSTSLCLQCHLPAATAESWKTSTHASVDCIVCHRSPGGLSGAFDTRLRGVQNGIAAAFPGKSATIVIVDTDSCVSCHKADLEGTKTFNGITIRHTDFIDQVSCKQCHGRVGHQASGTIVGAAASAVMSACADCHDGKTASKECTTCHQGDFALANKDSGGFAKVDLPAPATCRGCHDLTGCTTCHGIEMPHPPNWADPKVHAKAGAFDTTVCVRCHDSTCSPCHSQIHGSHGAGYKEEHKKSTDGTWCTLRCHEKDKVGTDMCTLCHSKR